VEEEGGGSAPCGEHAQTQIQEIIKEHMYPVRALSLKWELPVREISLEASGEEGADEGLQVGDAEVAPHHRLQLLSRILVLIWFSIFF
jgi:hypothetical protein